MTAGYPFTELGICLAGMYCAGCAARRARPGPGQEHHTPEGFRNLGDGYEERGLRDLLRWNLERRHLHIPGPQDYHFPLARNDPAWLRANRSVNTFTWIGHASALVQVQGMNILTDPL